MANFNSSGMESLDLGSVLSPILPINLHEPFALSPKDVEMVQEEVFFSTDEFWREDDMGHRVIDNLALDEISFTGDVSSTVEAEEPTIIMKSIQEEIDERIKEVDTLRKVRKPQKRRLRKKTKSTQTDESDLVKPKTKARNRPIPSGDDRQVEINPGRPQKATTSRKEVASGSNNPVENKASAKGKAKKKSATAKTTLKKVNKFTEKEINNKDDLTQRSEEDFSEEPFIVPSSENNSEQDLEMPAPIEVPCPKVVTVSKPNLNEPREDQRRTFVIKLKLPKAGEGTSHELEKQSLEVGMEPTPNALPAMASQVILAEPENQTLQKSERQETKKNKNENKKRKGLKKRKEEIREMALLKKALKKVEKKNKRDKKEAAKLKRINSKYKRRHRSGHYKSDSDTSTDS